MHVAKMRKEMDGFMRTLAVRSSKYIGTSCIHVCHAHLDGATRRNGWYFMHTLEYLASSSKRYRSAKHPKDYCLY
jgi:hypothetical protein